MLPLSVVAQQAGTTVELSSEEVLLVLEKNRDLLDTIDALTEKLGLASGENPWADYQQQIQSLESELGDVRGQLGLAERRMSENAALVDNLRSQHRERVEQLQKQLLDAHALQDKLESSEALAEAGQNEIDQLKSDLSDQQQLIGSLRTDLGSTNIDLKATTSAIEKQKLAASLQQLEFEELERANAAIRDQIRKKNKIIKRQDVGVTKLNELNSVLSSNLADASGAYQQCSIELDATDQNLMRTQQANISLQQNLDSRAKVIRKQDAGITRLLGKIDSLNTNLESAQVAARARIEELDGELAALEAMNAAGEESRQNMQTNIERLQSANNLAGQKVNQLEIQSGKLGDELAALREREATLTASLDESRLVAEATNERNNELKDQLSKQADELVIANNDKAGLREINQGLGEQIGTLEQNLAEREHMLAKLGESIDELQNAKSGVEEALQAANGEIDGLQSEKAGMSEKLAALDQGLAEREQMIVTLKEMQSGLEQSLAGTVEQLASSEQEGRGLRDDISKLLDREASLQASLDESRLIAEAAENRSLDLSEEISKQQEQLRAMAEENVELDDLNTALHIEAATPYKEAIALRDHVGAKLKEQGITNTVLAIRPDNTVTFQIPNELLFVSGSARLYKSGRTLLLQVAEALSETGNEVMVRVEGHTDSVPVAEKFQHIFPSNWYLSVARSAMAVDYLQNEGGMSPMRLKATGYGEFRPLTSNDTPEGRNRNRRVEVVLVPERVSGGAGS